jgi:hypothetical protein
MGSIRVKRFPEGSRTNDIRAYLKEYEIQTGKKPDAIVIDYLDIMMPNDRRINPSDLFVKDKFVSEELRGLAHEWNILLSTASQLGRSAVEEHVHDMHHIAGGISKVNTADNVMTVYASKAMKERGEYQVQFIKTRSSSGVGHSILLAFDPSTLRITDMPEGVEVRSGSGGNKSQEAIAEELAQKRKAKKGHVEHTVSIDENTGEVVEYKPSPAQHSDSDIAARRAKMLSMINDVQNG